MDALFTWALHLQAAVNCAPHEVAPVTSDGLGILTGGLLMKWLEDPDPAVMSGTSVGGKVAG